MASSCSEVVLAAGLTSLLLLLQLLQGGDSGSGGWPARQPASRCSKVIVSPSQLFKLGTGMAWLGPHGCLQAHQVRCSYGAGAEKGPANPQLLGAGREETAVEGGGGGRNWLGRRGIWYWLSFGRGADRAGQAPDPMT